MGISKKSFLSLFLSFCLVFSLISALLVKPVDAKTVRVAVIASLSGDVTIKKGGGSKSYDAYENMSLNQGDTVYTGDGSSVTLNLSNGDSDVTLGENAEVNVSDLNTSNGNKKSKLKVWAGSMWVKVKSLAGTDDEFEVETPTAVMGVRGTQFYVAVDPVTGKIKMMVGAGKVSASTVTNDPDAIQKTSITYLYPTQQISLDSRDETNDLSLKVEFLDLEDFIRDASPEVIKEIIRNKAEIDKENEDFIAQKKKEIADGKDVGDQTSLVVKNLAELDKVKQNLDNLVGNIAKQALADNKIDKDSLNKVIEEANKKISEEVKKIVLDKVVPLDKTAGIDPEKEKKKQEELQKLEAEKLRQKLEEEKKQEEIKKKLAAALKALEEQKTKISEATKAAEEKAKAEAESKLKSGLSDKEKEKYDKEKKGSTTSGNTGNGGSPSDSNSSSAPSLTVASATINEDVANDGSITATQVVTLANGTFDTDLSKGVTVNNLPAGLTASVTRNNNTQISITFSGKATNHAASNDVSNATITIAKAKIVGATDNVTSNAFEIKFADPAPTLTVASAIIAEAAANDGSFTATQVITLANGTFGADLNTGVIVNNLPAGLTASVTRNSNTQITITFTGNAVLHSTANDVANATVTIAKAKIVGATGDVTTSAFKFKFSDPIPKVSLAVAPVNNSLNGEFTLDINLSDFAGVNSIYGVEVHLLYGENTTYNTTILPVNGNIFSSANSADHIREYKGYEQKELIYAVTNFGAPENNENNDEFGNIKVIGPKKLVTIPLEGDGAHTISIGKIVIVRKNGSTVQNIEIPLTSIPPVTITTEVHGV